MEIYWTRKGHNHFKIFFQTSTYEGISNIKKGLETKESARDVISRVLNDKNQFLFGGMTKIENLVDNFQIKKEKKHIIRKEKNFSTEKNEIYIK